MGPAHLSRVNWLPRDHGYPLDSCIGYRADGGAKYASRIVMIRFCSPSMANGNTFMALLLDELRINHRDKGYPRSQLPSVLSISVVYVNHKHSSATSCVASTRQAIYVPFQFPGIEVRCTNRFFNVVRVLK